MSRTRERLLSTAAHECPRDAASREAPRGTRPPNNLPADVLWGIREIAGYIRRSERQTYHLIATGALPSKKIGAKLIVARKSEIERVMSSQDAPR